PILLAVVETDREAMRPDGWKFRRCLLLDSKGTDRVALRAGQRPERVEAGRLQPELRPGFQVAAGACLDIGEEVGEARIRILPLLDVALDPAKEGVLTDVGDELAQNAGPLVVGDGVEVQVDGLDVRHVGRNGVRGWQLILTARAGLVLVRERSEE